MDKLEFNKQSRRSDNNFFLDILNYKDSGVVMALLKVFKCVSKLIERDIADGRELTE